MHLNAVGRVFVVICKKNCNQTILYCDTNGLNGKCKLQFPCYLKKMQIKHKLYLHTERKRERHRETQERKREWEM